MAKQKQGSLDPEKISITEFHIIKGEIDNPIEFELHDEVEHKFSVDFQLGFAPEVKLVKADFNVTVETESNGANEQEVKGCFHFAYVFQVENIEELTEINNEELFVSPTLGNALASISYSTSRGILMTRFQGTALSSFILPVIDPNELVKNAIKNAESPNG